ncbi:diguanylate cyclase domain-containing protein [Rhodococcus opacus]|uniref:diguanylate cyclase domain-containing protein n=1 Tax=Rhodococcus opacus TaxID=37919 RepID=UPI001F53EE97|nr:GGDEF domain-containing protein [Rhodococcus opacus]
MTAVLSAAIRRIEAEAALVHQSLHDPLTGLPNRALARRRLDEALVTAPRGGTRVALLLVDLDDFKVVNDSLGHAGGDDALIVLARAESLDWPISASIGVALSDPECDRCTAADVAGSRGRR